MAFLENILTGGGCSGASGVSGERGWGASGKEEEEEESYSGYQKNSTINIHWSVFIESKIGILWGQKSIFTVSKADKYTAACILDGTTQID